MADVTINQLPAKLSIQETDEIEIDDGASKKVTAIQVAQLGNSYADSAAANAVSTHDSDIAAHGQTEIGRTILTSVDVDAVRSTLQLAAIATSGSATDISTGVLGSQFGGAGTVNGILKAAGDGAVGAAVPNQDYATPAYAFAQALIFG